MFMGSLCYVSDLYANIKTIIVGFLQQKIVYKIHSFIHSFINPFIYLTMVRKIKCRKLQLYLLINNDLK